LRGGAARGGKCSRPVNLQDIYPTLIELCGLPGKDDVSGNSLVPLLKDPKAKWDKPAITCLEVWGEMALSTERYRYIRYSDGGEELYDLTKDKEEWHNLASDPNYATIKKKLADRLPKNPASYVKTEKSPGYRKKK
jgi:arylsulfatase A-like enzyme